MATRQIEIFVGNCPLCEETIQLIQSVASSTYEILVYHLQEGLGKAQQYGVKAVPSVAVDGMLVLTGKPSRSQLEAAGIIELSSSSHEFNYLGMYI